MSEKAKFTAGTWLKSETPTGKPKVVCGKGGFTIATAGAPPCNHHDFYLIAAAPELYEALEYALPYLQAAVPNPRDGINPDGSTNVNCVSRAIAALAKARGES